MAAYVPYIFGANDGSDLGSNEAQLYATVDPSLVAEADFNHLAGTNGFFARGVMGALTSDSIVGSLSRDAYNADPLNPMRLGGGQAQIGLGRLLSPDEATQTYGGDGLKWDAPVYEATARYQSQLHQDDLGYQAVSSFAPSNAATTLLRFGANLSSSFTDPAQLALNLVPPLRVGELGSVLAGESGLRALIGDGSQYIGQNFLQRAATRAGEGLSTGLLTGAAAGGMDWALSSQEKRDYSMSNFLSSMLYGGLFYGAAHTGFGAVGDIFSYLKDPSGFLPQVRGQAPRVVPGSLIMRPDDFAQLSAQGGDYGRMAALNDHVIAAELQQGRLLSTADRLQVMENTNGAPVADGMGDRVAQEKAARVQGFQQADQQRAQLDRGAVDLATTKRPQQDVNGRVGGSESIGQSYSPDEQQAALESATREAEQFWTQTENQRPQTLAASAKAQTSAWREVAVQVHPDQASLEQAVPGEAAKTQAAAAQGQKRLIKALYDPATGTVHVNAEAVKTTTDLANVLRHEGAHIGFARVFGRDAGEWKRITGDIYDDLQSKGEGPRLDKIARDYGFDPDNERSSIVEEYMAREAERTGDSSIVDSFLGHLKRMLSKVFPAAVRWSASDMRRLITMARRGLSENVSGEKARRYSQELTPENRAKYQATSPVRIDSPRFRNMSRKEVARWARENIRGAVHTPALNGDVNITGTGLDKQVSGNRPDLVDHLEAVGELPELLKKAVLIRSRPDRADDPNIKAIHTLLAPLEVEGRPYDARMLVKETRDGRFLYNHDLTRIQERESQPQVTGETMPEQRANPTSATGHGENAPENGDSQPRYNQSFEDEDDAALREERVSFLNQAINDAQDRAAYFKALEDKRQLYLDLAAKNQIDDYLSRFHDPYEGLQAYLVGTNRLRTGARLGISERQHGVERLYQSKLYLDLTKENLWREYSAKACERDIARELWRQSQPDEIRDTFPRASDSKFERIAEIIREAQTGLINRANRAGAFISKIPGFLFRQTHDMVKVRDAGFDAWRDFIHDKLDWSRIELSHLLEGNGRLDHDQFLQGAWDGIVTGVHLHDSAPLRPTGRPMPANLANRLSASRRLHFASSDDFLDYNDKFGTGSLKDAVLSGLSHLAHSTVLLEQLGPTPELAFQRTMNRLRIEERFNRPRGLLDSLMRYGTADMTGRLEQLFGSVAGLDRVPGNVSFARIGSAVRVWENMVKLGSVLFAVIPDVATKEAELRYQGIPSLMALDDIISGPVRNTFDAGAKQVAASLGAGMESMLSDTLQRMSPQAVYGDRLRAVQNTFFKWTGLSWWTDMQKRGTARTMSAWLGMNADKEWAGLNENTRRVLQLYSLGEQHWDALRGLASVEADGRKYVLPEHAQAIPDGTVRDLKSAEGFGGSNTSYRDELQTRLMTYYTDRADYATVTPGAFERSLLTFGTRPGTLQGEAVRCMAQFKYFAVSMMTRMLAREIYGREGTMERIAGLSSMVGLVTLFGYASLQLGALASGKTPYPPSWRLFQASMSRGGGLGLLTDYLFGEYDPNRGMAEDIMGPFVGDLNAANNLRAKLMDGQGLSASDVRTIRGMVPFNNLVGLKTIIDYGAQYQMQEALNPGYLSRMERELQTKSGQQYLVPPSQVVR